MTCSNIFFSSLISVRYPILSWSKRIDNFFQLVDTSSCELVILPCSSLETKCLFLPVDDQSCLCTQLNNELEHD